MPVDTYVILDGNIFRVDELFSFTMAKPNDASSRNRSFDGTMRIYTVFFKDEFVLNFPKLTQSQANLLNKLLSQTGVDVLHTLNYVTPEITRIYDDVTTPTSIINADVGRIRGRVMAHDWSIPHWPNQANFYSASIPFTES